MELKLDKGEYAVGYARICGGILILTNSRLIVEHGFRVFGKKTESILINDIRDVESGSGFFFGNSIDIKYKAGNKGKTVFFEFPELAKADEIAAKVRFLQKGEVLPEVEVPAGEMGGIPVEEAGRIALEFMEKRVHGIQVVEVKHIAGAWNVVLSNHETYIVVVAGNGKIEAWKKLTNSDDY